MSNNIATEKKLSSLPIKTVIHYPRTADTGQKYLMTVDLIPMEDEWPDEYEQEEYSIYCMIQTDFFTSEPIDEPVVVLHRFGGTYGPAEFLLIAQQKVTEGASITVTLSNEAGMSMKSVNLEGIRIVEKDKKPPLRVNVPPKVSDLRSGAPGSGSRRNQVSKVSRRTTLKTTKEKEATPYKEPHTRENIASFSWLHLTDLHIGRNGEYSLSSGGKNLFFSDLTGLYKECGPWDVVFISGNLTQTGRIYEFIQLNKMLEELWAVFRKLARKNDQNIPILLVVPGEHDLTRPRQSSPSVLLLRQWTEQEQWVHLNDVSHDFWGNKSSAYRETVERTFQYYTIWREKSPLTTTMKRGVLPGDFSVSINKGGFKIGILGINTSFLQISDGDYKGKLVLDARQFHGACDGDGIKWADQHHVCFLLTHHPPEWLSIEAIKNLNQEILSHKRFLIHLCGHWEGSKTAFTEHAVAGNKSQYTLQGKPLFKDGEGIKGEEDLFGYSAGKIEWNEQMSKGTLKLYPRTGRLQGNEINFVPDHSFHLPHDSIHTLPIQFDLPKIDVEKNRFVFVNVAPQDKDGSYANETIDFLKEHKIAYSLPINESEVSAAEMRRDLEQNLIDCDATLLICDTASIAWLRHQLRYCIRIQGRRRGKKSERKEEKELKIIVLMKSPELLDMVYPGMRLLACPPRKNEDCSKKFMEAFLPIQFDLPKIDVEKNRFVFVNVAPQDKDGSYANETIDFLKEHKIAYSLPISEPEVSATEIRRDLEQNLIECDATLLICDTASIAWLRSQLRYCIRIQGRRRGKKSGRKEEKELRIIVLMKSPELLDMVYPGMRLLECPPRQNEDCAKKFMEALNNESQE